MSVNGSLLFAKYAYAPNKLRYCGPDANRDIFDYCVAQQSDQGLVQLLEKFEGAYPYLKLIARSNKIKDVFDEKVVEAYWIGNELLKFVTDNVFYNSLKERFGKKIPSKNIEWLLSKPPAGAKPHHAFHVLDVYTRTGLIRSGVKTNVLETINNCLIMWGKVIHVTCNMKHVTKIRIKYNPIVFKKGKLDFGEIKEKEVESQFINPRIGGWVSVHWNWACDILDSCQLKNLQYWTHYHLNIANQTI